jgi:hypothetical protein
VLDFPILEVTRMKPVFVVAVSLAFVVGAFACPGVTLVGGGTLCPDGGSEVCDDGIFCTGVERCVAGTCQREPVRCDDGIACSVDRCDRALDRCVSSAPDVDQDGFGDSACLGAGSRWVRTAMTRTRTSRPETSRSVTTQGSTRTAIATPSGLATSTQTSTSTWPVSSALPMAAA